MNIASGQAVAGGVIEGMVLLSRSKSCGEVGLTAGHALAGDVLGRMTVLAMARSESCASVNIASIQPFADGVLERMTVLART